MIARIALVSVGGIAVCGLAMVAFTPRGRLQIPLLPVSSTPQPPMPMPYPYIPSPHWDERPPGTEVNCVVLHSTVTATLKDTIRAFQSPMRKVSIHYVVAKDGRVVQMVPVEKRAWHAGESVLEGVPRVNDYSVGIEMVNRNNGRDPYPDSQYEAVAGIIRFLRSRYTIPDSRIVSHAQIVLPPGRKSDPLGFDWDKLSRILQEISPPSSQ